MAAMINGPLSLTEALANPHDARCLRLQTGDVKVFALSEEMATLVNVEEITIDGTVERVERCELLAKLPRLRILRIGYRLTEVPAALGALAGLEELQVRGSFPVLPDALAGLGALKTLDVNARLESFPAWIGKLTRLEVLRAPHCGIDRIPEEIGRLAELRTLAVTGNRLRELPETLRSCTKLTWLDVGQNQITFLPAWLSELMNLRGLAARDNPPLRNVPADLMRVADGSIEIERFEPAARAVLEAEAAAAFAQLESAATAKARPAFIPALRPQGWGRTHLGGLPWLAAGEPWPVCRICDEPMPLWLQLDAADLPAEMRAAVDGGLLQWFRCLGEPNTNRMLAILAARSDVVDASYLETLDTLVARAGPDLVRRVGAAIRARGGSMPPELRAELLAADASDADAAFLLGGPCMFLSSSDVDGFQIARIVDATDPGRTVEPAEAPRSTFGPLYPDAEKWEPIADRPQPVESGVDEYWEVATRLDKERRQRVYAWTQMGDKLGGWPIWAQSDDCAPCPICGADIRRLVFQITGDTSAIPWSSSGVVLLLQCPNHPRQLQAITQHD